MSEKIIVMRKGRRTRNRVQRPAASRRRAARPKARRTTNRNKVSSNMGIGEQIGRGVGGFLGKAAQALVLSVAGFGDYHIKNNSLMNGGMSPPMIVNSANSGGFIMRHREYLGDVLASTNFAITKYPLNPGLVLTFPWLSQPAEAFEEYRFRGLIFEFKSTSSDAVLSTAANSALGTVIMATQYNALSPIFPDKRTMENYEFANSGKPSISFIHPVECAQSQTPVDHLYVRTGSVPDGADIRLYDLADFYIATQGMQVAGGTIGELWCTFEIEFYKPKLVAGIGYELLTDHLQLSSITNSAPLGTVYTIVPGSNIGVTVTTVGTLIQFPSYITDGSYLFYYIVYLSSAATSYPPGFGPSNGYFEFIWQNDTLSGVGTTPYTDTNRIMVTGVITITGPNATISCGVAGFGATVIAGDLIVTQINGAILT
jgi:hypothetical protein